ncbi:MAG TPA: carbon-nitrogen hydrolase family protein [Gemmatimonadales bacterium]|nr:carbon-nitrogen hydrolase family protein [Gemmatimonadales bacterium]
MSKFRVAVCEVPAVLSPGARAWDSLVQRVRRLRPRPDVFVLNEMPFGNWLASGPRRVQRLLRESHEAHERGISRLDELGVPVVIGTQAVMRDAGSVNAGFVWTAGGGLQMPHTKQFFPDEPGYYEARWFERGNEKFAVVEARGLKIAFLICTDLWFLQWARQYGKLGADLIVVPRATPRSSLARWKTGVAAAALVSGCYVASSNRVGRDRQGMVFGGRGWIFDPSGRQLAATSAQRPIAVATIDTAVAQRAKQEYPQYVKDLE